MDFDDLLRAGIMRAGHAHGGAGANGNRRTIRVNSKTDRNDKKSQTGPSPEAGGMEAVVERTSHDVTVCSDVGTKSYLACAGPHPSS